MTDFSFSGEVVICATDARSRRSVIDKIEKNSFVWAYLGNDPKAADQLVASIGMGSRIEISELIEAAADRLRQSYIDYIGHLSERNPQRWWHSNIAEKNPYVSDAFLFLCSISACGELLRAHQNKTVIVLFVESSTLRRGLAVNLPVGRQQLRIITNTYRERAEFVRVTCAVVTRKFGWLVVNAARVIYTRYLLRLHKKHPLPEIVRNKQKVSLIHVWVDKRAHDPKTGEFRDNDFADVTAVLRQRGNVVLAVPNILRTASYLRAVKFVAGLPEAHYLVPHAMLRVRDVFAVAARALAAFPIGRSYPTFNGMDVSPVFCSEERKQWKSLRSESIFIMQEFVESWRRAGLRIERFIYTFENHCWERVVCAAFRRLYPEAKLIAHQPNGMPRFLLNYFISSDESRRVPLPNVIVTNGSYAAEVLMDSGYMRGQIVCGAGLRTRHLASEPYSINPVRENHNHVIVTPSIGRVETVELLRKAILAFAQSDKLTVTLKCHPTMPFETVAESLDDLQLPNHIHVSNQPLKTLLSTADVLVYNGVTFPSVEALAKGLGVVFVRPDFGLPLDPLEGYPHLRMEATSPPEIACCVRRLLMRDQVAWESAAKMAEEAVIELIGKVDESTFELFVN